MVTVKVVVVDEDGNPQRGVTVVAYSLANFPDIAARQETDDAGSAEFNLSGVGPVFFDAFNRRGLSLRDRNYPGKIQIQIVAFGGFVCYDYVVECDGFGTHETLGGATGAWAAAAAAGGNKTIWMCCSETLTSSLTIPTGLDSSIAIHAAVAHELNLSTVANVSRVSITAPVNEPIFRETMVSNGFTMRLNLRNLGLIWGSAEGMIELLNSGLTNSNIDALEIEGCQLTAGSVMMAVGIINSSVQMRVSRCGGSITYLYDRTASSGSMPDLIELNNSRGLVMSELWTAVNDANPERATIQGGEITLSGQTNLSAAEDISVQNIIIDASNTTFVSNGTSQNTRRLTFQDITYRSVGASAKFCDLQSSAINPGSNVMIHGVHGMFKSGGAVSGTFITVSTNFTSVLVADILAPDWPTLYSGPTPSTGLPAKFAPPVEIEGAPDAGTGAMLILDNTDASRATSIIWQRTGVWTSYIAEAPTSGFSAFEANRAAGDIFIGVVSSAGTVFHVPVALANDGSALRIFTAQLNHGYLRVGAGTTFTVPTNTAAGDFTATRIKVGDGAFGAGVDFSVTGDGALSGFLQVGSETAPINIGAGDLTGVRLSLGNTALGGVNGAIVDIRGTQTDTAAASRPTMLVNPTIAPASNSSSDFRTLYYSAFLTPATGVTMNVVTAGYFEIRDRSDAAISALAALSARPLVVDSSSPATVGVVSLTVGVDVFHHVRPSGTSSVNVTSAAGIRFPTARVGSGYTADFLREIHIVGMNFGAVTDYVSIDIERPTTAPSGINAAFRTNGRMVYSPTAQTLAAAGNTILSTARLVDVDNSTGASLTLTSTPTIGAGTADGQLLTITNVDSADNIVLQDESVLAGTALRLPGAANLTLGPRDSATFRWRAAASEWWCVATSNL